MGPIPVYCAQTSSRLTYILDWIFIEQLQTGYVLINDISEAAKHAHFVSYGSTHGTAISIPNSLLLWQTDILEHDIAVGKWNELTTLYSNTEESYNVPFDIFSALFFLLSRYEEYYTYPGDKHNRYPATASVLYKHNLLEHPIADEWILAFRKLLSENFTLPASKPFCFQPTYDIDIAYSLTHKGLRRTLGGYLKDALSGNIKNMQARTSCLLGSQDPYDSFTWLNTLHTENNYKPIYFILAASRRGPYDKNIPLKNNSMKLLARKLYAEGTVGLHPSYYSNRNTALFTSEKYALIKVVRNPVIISRQHYIKNQIPFTYNLLLSNNISADYSMGYATHTGFRAGTSQSFLWYNLKKEKVTKLRIYPFCFMDTTAKYEMVLEANEAFEKLELLTTRLKKVNGLLITVFHNFSLGTDPAWEGWKDLYEEFLLRMTPTS